MPPWRTWTPRNRKGQPWSPLLCTSGKPRLTLRSHDGAGVYGRQCHPPPPPATHSQVRRPDGDQREGDPGDSCPYQAVRDAPRHVSLITLSHYGSRHNHQKDALPHRYSVSWHTSGTQSVGVQAWPEAQSLPIGVSCDIPLLELLAQQEINPPFPSAALSLVDSESKEELRLLWTERLREQYQRVLDRHNRELRSFCHQAGIHYSLYITDQDISEFVLETLPSVGLFK